MEKHRSELDSLHPPYYKFAALVSKALERASEPAGSIAPSEGSSDGHFGYHSDSPSDDSYEECKQGDAQGRYWPSYA